MAPEQRKQRVMVPPINMLFSFLKDQTPVQVWLYEQVDSRLEGTVRGFDEFMNLVLDDTVEVNYKKNTRRELGRILLKGDNITLVSALETTA
ncbi:similar to Saccharomyces cerevisiae YOR159C SME1 Core Sm protein SmE, part of heteroheptameric complex (with Smb1p, Smd1p, Smd2p, Smd3p, Smx3p, and Smx2p) that is part of the spliceosomal U1 [Geotrichum candidum]|uniref:Small nuclear ribonucleoprotein E n=1 Tax=Geotrichum candidum TaxID=1173061 RepID=A0A0J9X688_GEOCN|nr:similar to Saccharomyces cerevisiae YOR159C SME1 Core Sm protein SmE, part of heteroheptameric complex (with Smb1p, Smd1p, Smd2p, Smd3p, Smx3p, and Smx2p) that is part of the spliceosomal U1 [Geotrichum candidum]